MQTLPEPYRFSRREYRRLGELGFFAGRRVELIEGQIIAMSPKGPRHRVATKRAERALERVFPWTRAPDLPPPGARPSQRDGLPLRRAAPGGAGRGNRAAGRA